MNYKQIESQLVDNSITVEEFDALSAFAKENGDHAKEVKTLDEDGDLVYLTWVNEYQMTYVRTSHLRAVNEKEVGVFAKLITKHIDNTVNIRDIYK